MGNYQPNIKNLPNTIFFFEKKISIVKKIFNFFYFSFLKKVKYKLSIDLSFFTQESFFSIHLFEKIKPFFKKDLKVVLMPYENQPFQSLIINNLKKKYNVLKIIGYVHSFPSFPTHFLKSENCPDKLIVNSDDQKKVFQKYLKWNENQLVLLPSMRFSENDTNLKKNIIYLPIDFNSSELILSSFKLLTETHKNINFADFKIRNHPAAEKSKKHKDLIINLSDYLKKKSVNTASSKKVAIFIGSTGAIIEALKHNFEVIHIYENSIFDLYHNFMWPSINCEFVNDKVVKYKLVNYKSIIFNNNQDLLENYLSA